MRNAIITATLVAGTLDILAAIRLTLFYDRAVPDMLRYVASGPFPGATGWGAGGAVLGLVVHFTLMAIMVAAYVWAAQRWPVLATNAIWWGIAYGLVTYVVMNLIVVPARFCNFPHLRGIVTQLFCHIVLVGIPIALIAARSLRARPFG
ncbi:MAG: DUF1440 domain-containing protein [Pseudomonadota bacterium]|nr:DUF1440 domain-containing protein [Pseudomonadota bacterium]